MALCEIFFGEFWGRGILSAAKASSFLRENCIRQVFSLQSFRCTVLPRLHDPVADWISGKDRRLAQRSYSLARCGWLAILRGWAGEHRKIRVSPEKSGWVGRSATEQFSNATLCEPMFKKEQQLLSWNNKWRPFFPTLFYLILLETSFFTFSIMHSTTSLSTLTILVPWGKTDSR